MAGLFIGALVVLAIFIAIGVGALLFFLRWLANGDVMFTTVQEGTSKAIMRGKNFDCLIMAFKGHHLNYPGKPWFVTEIDLGGRTVPVDPWDVLPNDPDKEDKDYDDRFFLFRRLGIFYVGIPDFARSLYRYRFQWNEFRLDKDHRGRDCIETRDRPTDFVYVKDFPYAFVLDDIKTIDPLPIDVIYILTAAIVNPYKALFATEDWLQQVTAAADRKARAFIGARTYLEIISELKDDSDKEDLTRNFSTPIVNLTRELPDKDPDTGKIVGLRDKYGVAIRTADLQDTDLSGAAKATHEASTLKAYDAKQNAEAIRTETDANAYQIERLGSAEANSLKSRLDVIAERGNLGALLAQLDAMRADGPGKTVIWANNPFIQQFGLPAALLDSLGINTPDALKEFIQKTVTQPQETA